jgi:hypothetical protein
MSTTIITIIDRYNQDQIRLNQAENCMVHITISQAMQETELETIRVLCRHIAIYCCLRISFCFYC